MNINQEVWLKIANINSFLKPLREVNKNLNIETSDLIDLRIKLRDQLEYLRLLITEKYSDRDAYFVIFPLTAYCDEIIKRSIIDVQSLEWLPLQKELYKIDNAGDLFYELLDNILIKTETLSLVYEVYYFCLKDGFHGRYGLSSVKDSYLKKIEKHIFIKPISIIKIKQNTKKRRHFRIPNYSYYCVSVVLIIIVYFFLTFLANSWLYI